MTNVDNLNSQCLAVDESIRIFDREKRRKEIIENKASTLLNSVTLVVTIFISVLGFIFSSDVFKNPSFFIFYILGIIALTNCIILLICVLRTKGYIDPFKQMILTC